MANQFKPPGAKTTIQDSLDGRRRALGVVTLVLFVVLFVSWKQKGSFSASSQFLPVLQNQPVQEATDRLPFDMVYKGKTVRVEPVADYELWGLVVSHNNIKSVADIYHDGSSVDTKDLCVAWGSNLVSGDLGKVDFKSGPWTCYYSFERGTKFYGSEFSNSHLVTDKKELRAALDDVRIGDQIRVKGALVNYQVEDWKDFWRKSSTVRDDSGNGACEVIFFEELEVLSAGTPYWYLAFGLSLFLLATVPVVFMHSIWIDSKRLAKAAYREPAFDGVAPPEIWQGQVEG